MFVEVLCKQTYDGSFMVANTHLVFDEVQVFKYAIIKIG
jgi:hypothetical protein